jgi:hypothetical protein
MSVFVPLVVPVSDSPTLHSRLVALERRCAELWAHEPTTSAHRETLFAQLSEIEHRLVCLLLKSITEPDDEALAPAAESCERRLDELAALWSAPRAA